MSLTIARAIAGASRRLAAAGLPDAARDARALVAAASGIARDRLTLNAETEIAAEGEARLDAYLTDRLNRRPVSHIIGNRLFWGRAFEVTGDVLDPRPETETIIAAALGFGPAPRVLDLGTGSGVLAVTLAAEWPHSRVSATDISRPALDVAALNARAHRVSERIDFVEADWWGGVDGIYDLIVSNPPYIAEGELETLEPEVRDWEPHLALSPGPDPMTAYRAIAAGLEAHLAPKGCALLECGEGQCREVGQIFEMAGPFQMEAIADMDGRARVARISIKHEF